MNMNAKNMKLPWRLPGHDLSSPARGWLSGMKPRQSRVDCADSEFHIGVPVVIVSCLTCSFVDMYTRDLVVD